MKTKFFSLLLMVILLFSFTSCYNFNATTSTSSRYPTNTSESCIHNWKSATCTEAKTCKLCGETSGSALGHTWKSATCTEAKTCKLCNKTSGSALGHTTQTGICSRCNKNMGTWKKQAYVDEFDTPTGEYFISTTASGKFSDSATTDSSLKAEIQVDSENVYIILWKYTSSMVKCTHGYNDYSITILDTSNNKHYLSGTMYAGDFRIRIDFSDKQTVLNILQKSGIINFHIVNLKHTITTYTFSLQNSNFKEVYAQI